MPQSFSQVGYAGNAGQTMDMRFTATSAGWGAAPGAFPMSTVAPCTDTGGLPLQLQSVYHQARTNLEWQRMNEPAEQNWQGRPMSIRTNIDASGASSSSLAVMPAGLLYSCPSTAPSPVVASANHAQQALQVIPSFPQTCEKKDTNNQTDSQAVCALLGLSAA
jgi:hypothetical protein